MAVVRARKKWLKPDLERSRPRRRSSRCGRRARRSAWFARTTIASAFQRMIEVIRSSMREVARIRRLLVERESCSGRPSTAARARRRRAPAPAPPAASAGRGRAPVPQRRTTAASASAHSRVSSGSSSRGSRHGAASRRISSGSILDIAPSYLRDAAGATTLRRAATRAQPAARRPAAMRTVSSNACCSPSDAGDALPDDVERGAAGRRRHRNRQAAVQRDAALEAHQLHRDLALVVVHRHDARRSRRAAPR